MISVLINTHLLMAAQEAGVERLLLRVVGMRLQRRASRAPDVTALREEDAYPALPEDGYGWEKLFSRADVPALPRGLRHRDARRAVPQRLRPVTAPGTAAARRLRRPSAARSSQAKLTGKHEIEIWGDGEQTRSFMYIDDCLNGTLRIMDSEIREPINLGSAELVSDQRARRHRRGDRGHQAEAPIQPRRAQGRERPQLATTR